MTETLNEELEEKKKALDTLKAEVRELEERYTFKGLYKKIAGRKNVLTSVRDNSDLNEVEKFEKAKEVLTDFVKTL